MIQFKITKIAAVTCSLLLMPATNFKIQNMFSSNSVHRVCFILAWMWIQQCSGQKQMIFWTVEINFLKKIHLQKISLYYSMIFLAWGRQCSAAPILVQPRNKLVFELQVMFLPTYCRMSMTRCIFYTYFFFFFHIHLYLWEWRNFRPHLL